MYVYNGMENRGLPIRQDVEALNSDVKPGNSIHHAFYYLRGGIQAQNMFIKLRTDQLRAEYPLAFPNIDLASPIAIEYSSEDLSLMDPKKRTWLINPYKSSTSEYIPMNVAINPSSPMKIIESEDEEEDSMPIDAEEEDSIPIDDELSNTMTVDQSGAKELTVANIGQPPITHLSPAPSSEPDSLFAIHCRCGVTCDGNVFYNADDVGEAIQCEECKDWSHIACQRNRRASKLHKDDTFICDFCDLQTHPAVASAWSNRCIIVKLVTGQPNIIVSENKSRRKNMTNQPLKERLLYVIFVSCRMSRIINSKIIGEDVQHWLDMVTFGILCTLFILQTEKTGASGGGWAVSSKTQVLIQEQ